MLENILSTPVTPDIEEQETKTPIFAVTENNSNQSTPPSQLPKKPKIKKTPQDILRIF